MRSPRFIAPIVVFALLILLEGTAGPAAQARIVGDWDVRRATSMPSHAQTVGNGAISGNGRFVAFVSSLRRGGGYQGTYVFLKDFREGTLRRVAPAPGTIAEHTVSLSRRGGYLVYTAQRDSDATFRVMLYNTSTRQVSVVVESAKGGVISADGGHVAYLTQSLLDADSGEIRVRDLASGVDTVVTPLANYCCEGNLSISADGSAVAWWMHGSSRDSEAWHKDLDTGIRTRVDTSAAGRGGNLPATGVAPSMTADGRWVSFVSRATNLVPGTTGDHSRIYLKDTTTGAIRLLATRAYGGELSPDGRFFAYKRHAEYFTGPSRMRKVAGGAAIKLPPGSANGRLSTSGKYVIYNDYTARGDIYRAHRT